MTPADDPSLALEDVRARFDESTRLLDDVRDRIGGIVAGETQRASARDALTETAQAIQRLAESTMEATSTLSQAQRTAGEAFASLRSIADGTDLKAIREDVDAVGRRQREGVERQDEFERSTKSSLEDLASRLRGIPEEVEKAVTQQVGELRAAIEEKEKLERELTATKEQLAKLREAAGGRALKKAGLE